MAQREDEPSGRGARKVLLYACAGAPNVGRAAHRACRRLAEEGYGEMACLTALGARAEDKVQAARDADLNVVVSGCDEQCARKVFDNCRVDNYVQITVTDLDIEKGEGEPTAEQVTVVVNKLKETVEDL